MKIEQLEQDRSSDPQYMFYCPGCEMYHGFKTTGDTPRWSFNDDFEKPTLAPSVVVKYGESVCHSFVTEGRIEFLNDSTHKMAGRTVPLPDIE